MSHSADDDDNSDDSDVILCFCEEYFRMISWIHNAVRCNVEKLDLDISPGNEVSPQFPCSVFLCASLTSLSADLSYSSLHVPSTLPSNLKYLELQNGLVEDGFFKWISRCCKFIEELVLQDVAVDNITIEIPSLKKFSFVDSDSVDSLNISCEKLEEIVMDWMIQSPRKKSLNIFAPRLEYLSWKGNLLTDRRLGNFEFLEGAAILMEPKEDVFDNVFEVMCSLSTAKALTLNEETTMALFRERSMPAPLHNLLYLDLRIRSFVDELVPAMVSLLRGMPNLCKLRLNSKPPLDEPISDTSGYNMGYWKKQNLAFIDQLKEVDIELSNGSSGVELARYILGYAQNLEKMLVICLPQNLDDIVRRFDESKKVSSATVVFKENQL